MWLPSPGRMPSRPICVGAGPGYPSLLIAERIPLFEYVAVCLSVCLPGEHLGSFQFAAVKNITARSIHVQVCMDVRFHFSQVNTWERNAESCGDCVFNILGKWLQILLAIPGSLHCHMNSRVTPSAQVCYSCGWDHMGSVDHFVEDRYLNTECLDP